MQCSSNNYGTFIYLFIFFLVIAFFAFINFGLEICTLNICLDPNLKTMKAINFKVPTLIEYIMEKCSAQEPHYT